jgi:hypothetical protein
MNSAEDELLLFDCTHTSLLLRYGLVINSWFYALEDGVGVFALLEIYGEIVIVFESCLLKWRFLCLGFDKSFSEFTGIKLLRGNQRLIFLIIFDLLRLLFLTEI